MISGAPVRFAAAASLAAALAPAAAFAGHPPLSTTNDTFTTQRFSVVRENLSRVNEVSVGPDGKQLLILSLPACTKARSGDKPVRAAVVSGAPSGTFHAGDLVATGAVFKEKKPVPSIRTVARGELANLHC